MHEPRLVRITREDCTYWTDDALLSRAGVVVAFSERTGGLSTTPFASLNLAAHVGDKPANVDENRALFLSACGLDEFRERLVTAEQVHGTKVVLVDSADAGRGAWADSGRPPMEATDGVVTRDYGLPLMMFFADCVPVVLIALAPSRTAICVIHAGWRGVRDRIAVSGVHALVQAAECDPCNVLAYIGPHICGRNFEVGPEVISQFPGSFATVSRAGTGAIDLGAAVSASLAEAGVPMSAQCSLDACTAEHKDRFFSYRADGLTGRHGALVAMVGCEE